MITEQLEFRIAQYADGTLPASEVAALESELAANTEARALLEEYRALDASLKRDLPLPAINWDRLADHLSRAVAEEDRATTTYAISRTAYWGRVVVAVAAVLFIVTSLALWLRPRPADNVAINPPSTPNPTQLAVIDVTGPAAEAATQPAAVEIVIGPQSPADDANYRLADGIIYRPPRLTIASGEQPVQDYSRLPY